MIDQEQAQMIRELVRRFVEKELLPLEQQVLASGGPPELSAEQQLALELRAREYGLWGMDAPAELGGMNLPSSVMIGVYEELARSFFTFILPPDAPNVHMLNANATPSQRERYLKPYIDGQMISAIAISEPAAGGDPAGMITRAVRTDGGWTINGRKVWISRAHEADFTILMARVGDGKRHEGITSFIIERDTPGFVIERAIPMIGTHFTYEIVLDDCHLPADALLGEVGQGYAPMQLRLLTRRLEMGAACIGITQRALDMMADHALQRITFGTRLADRQAIQWWIADTEMRLHGLRLMVADAAAKLDAGVDVRHEASIIKTVGTELAYDTVDHAMQTLGALGMTKETALYPLWSKTRLMRIYEGPSEVHRESIAKRVLRRYA